MSSSSPRALSARVTSKSDAVTESLLQFAPLSEDQSAPARVRSAQLPLTRQVVSSREGRDAVRAAELAIAGMPRTKGAAGSDAVPPHSGSVLKAIPPSDVNRATGHRGAGNGCVLVKFWPVGAAPLCVLHLLIPRQLTLT